VHTPFQSLASHPPTTLCSASITAIGARIEPQAKLGRLVAELRVRIIGNSISSSLRKCVSPRQLLLEVVVVSGLQMVHQICR
jgi:hypothetical protein